MSGPIIAPASSDTPSIYPIMSEYIEALADQLGERLYSTVSTQAVSGGEPGRWVLIDDLKDDEKSRATFRDDGWVYLVNGAMAGSCRRVRSEGYEGPDGALAVASVFKSGSTPTTPADGTLVQVTRPLPWTQVGMTRGLAQLVNEGLSRVWTEARITFTGNGTARYDLSAYPIVTREALIDGVYDWAIGIPTTEEPLLAPYKPTITVNGATITLVTGYSYSTAVTFQLKVFVKGNRLIYTNGAWGFTTTGLENDTDQAAIPVEQELPVAMVKAIQYRTRMIVNDRSLSKDEKAEALAALPDRQHWARAAAKVIQETLPRKTSPAVQGMVDVAAPIPTAPLVGSTGWPT